MINDIKQQLELAIQDVENNRVKKKEEAYIAKLQKVLDFKQQAEGKRVAALSDVAELTEQINELNNEYIQETNQKKLDSLATKRKELRIELEDKKGVANTKFMQYVNEQLSELEADRQAMSSELIAYGSARQQLHQDLLAIMQITKGLAHRVHMTGPATSNEADSLTRQIKAQPQHEREIEAMEDRTMRVTDIDGWTGRTSRVK